MAVSLAVLNLTKPKFFNKAFQRELSAAKPNNSQIPRVHNYHSSKIELTMQSFRLFRTLSALSKPLSKAQRFHIPAMGSDQ
jgi:hypothetical protein